MFKDIDIKWVGAAVGLILTIGGGFTWFGVTNNKLDALSNVKSTVTENSKRTEINQKEIELLKLNVFLSNGFFDTRFINPAIEFGP